MSDDPSPSSFPVHGVTANLLPAGAPASGPEMRVQYLKLHLLATCVLTLWLKVFLLDQKSSQNDLCKMPRNSSKTCDCPQNSLRKCICSSEVREDSTCLGIPGESVWLDEHFEMDVEPLMRMNQAPVQGFEADVGKRTTVRITYPTIDSPQDPGAQLLLLPLNSSGLKWVMDIVQKDSIIQKAENPGFQIVQVTHGSNEKKDKVSVISLSFLQYVQQRWLGKHGHFPSLGFITLLYALHTCDQILNSEHFIMSHIYFYLIKK
ncbi:hypothetical protein R6Z07F_012518 [Ovis aries]